jgi:hypothetical protein
MYSIHALCACAALGIAAGFATSDASAALPIVAKHSGKCLDIAGGPGATQDGAPAEQWECTGATNQNWTLLNVGGRLQIIAEHSGKCLIAQGSVDGTALQQTTCNQNDTSQLWVQQSAGASGEFKFLQVRSGRCFEVDGGTQATGNGPLIKLKACNGAANQTWTVGRNPLYWPFTQSSIWNTPIGSGAVYVAANLTANADDTTDMFAAGVTPMPNIDEERIVLEPTAPLVTIEYSSAGWSASKNRCVATTPVPPGSALPVFDVPIPANYFVADHHFMNDGAAFLMADGHTLVQTQPFARCSADVSPTSIIHILDNGADADIVSGDGRKGAHGGSRLGTLGGTIRLGEMRPLSRGPRHALKFNLFSKMELYNCSAPNNCFRWPAYTADGGAVDDYGTILHPNNDNTAMKLGALLAIPPSVNIDTIGLLSEPGHQIAWTLQNYGAYIVDSHGQASFGMAVEAGSRGDKQDEFFADYGMTMEARVQTDSDWARDLQLIRTLLRVVDNNSPTSVGGGGTPRQPLAPPFQ